MSEKYGNLSATYNIPLNSSENDIFRIGCAHLYQFLQINVKMADCKPMMLKMHFELDDSPSTRETEDRNIDHNKFKNGWRQSVQQLEEEMKALKDACSKVDNVVNRIINTAPNVASNKQVNKENKVSGEHNNSENVANASEEHHTNNMPDEKPEAIDLRRCVHLSHVLHMNGKTADCKPIMLKMHVEPDHSPSTEEAEARNIEHNNSNNGLRQSVQSLLKDALLEAKDNVVIRIDKAPNVDNNATQESNSNNQANKENKVSGEHSDTENDASDSEEHHTNTMPEEEPDLKRNCIFIQNFQCADSSLGKAFCNIRNVIYMK